MPKYSKFRDEAYLHGRIPIPLPSNAISFIPAKLTARTEIVNPGWGVSDLTGVYDWIEMTLLQNGVWQEKYGGLSGSYAEGTGCVEMQFTNHALEYGDKIVYLQKLRSDPDSSSSGGGWTHMFDEAHNNVDGPYVEV
jgi:hypothetical protein